MRNIIHRYIIEKLYLIIPMICICIWALLQLIHANFIPFKNDFYAFYNASKQLYSDPKDLYKPELRFFHMPAFALFCALTVSLLPYFLAYYIFYIVNIFLGFIFLKEYDRILLLMNLRETKHRFMFLMIISNGMIVYSLFFQNSFKYLIGVLIIYVIRRDIQNRKEKKEKNLRYYILNFNLFAFAVAMFPPFIFYLLIYLFSDISLRDFFKKNNLKKYIILISAFSIQNFLFFIYPSLIVDFLGSYEGHNTLERGYFPLFYLREWVILDDYNPIFYIATLCIAITALILICNKGLSIELKFGYNSFAWIIFSAWGGRSFLIIFPFALLLYVTFLIQDKQGTEFIKKNKTILIGLLSVVGIYFMLPDFTIFKYFPQLEEYPIIIFVHLRYIFLLSIFVSSLLILYYQNFMSKR